MSEKAELRFGDQTVELDVIVGTEGERAIDIQQLRSQTGLITMDPVLVDGQSPVARFLALRDRGENVRTIDGYLALAATSFETVEPTVRHDMLRVPYSHALLTCTRTD